MTGTHKTQTTNRSDFMSTVAPLSIWTSDWRALALELSCVLTLQEQFQCYPFGPQAQDI